MSDGVSASMSIDRLLKEVMAGESCGGMHVIEKLFSGNHNNPSLRLYARNIAVRLIRRLENFDYVNCRRIFQLLINHYPHDLEVKEVYELNLGGPPRQPQTPVRVSSGSSDILARLRNRNPPVSSLLTQLTRDFSPKSTKTTTATRRRPSMTPTLVFSPRRILADSSSSSDDDGGRRSAMTTTSIMSSPAARPMSRSSHISIEDEYDISRNFKQKKWFKKWLVFIDSKRQFLDGLRRLIRIFERLKCRVVFKRLSDHSADCSVEEMEKNHYLQRLMEAIANRIIIQYWDSWRERFGRRKQVRHRHDLGATNFASVLKDAAGRRHRESMYLIALHADKDAAQIQSLKIFRKIFKKIISKYFLNFRVGISTGCAGRITQQCALLQLANTIGSRTRPALIMGLTKLKKQGSKTTKVNRVISILNSHVAQNRRFIFKHLRRRRDLAARLQRSMTLLTRKQGTIGFNAFRLNLLEARSRESTSRVFSLLRVCDERVRCNKRFGMRVFQSLLSVSRDTVCELEAKLVVSEMSQKLLRNDYEKLREELVQSRNASALIVDEVRSRRSEDVRRNVENFFGRWRKAVDRKKRKIQALYSLGRVLKNRIAWTTMIPYRSQLAAHRTRECGIRLMMSFFSKKISLEKFFPFRYQVTRILKSSNSLGDRIKRRTLGLVFSRLKKANMQSKKIKKVFRLLKTRIIQDAFNTMKESFWRSEILFAYSECDHYMQLVGAKTARYDTVMDMVDCKKSTETVSLLFNIWRLHARVKKIRLNRLMCILSDTGKRAGWRGLIIAGDRATLKTSGLFKFANCIQKIKIRFFFSSFMSLARHANDAVVVSIERVHRYDMLEHERITRDLAEAASSVEYDYRKLKSRESDLLMKHDVLEKRIVQVEAQLERETRENEMLLLKVNENMNSEIKLRQARASMEDIEQYRHVIEQQRQEIDILRNRVGEHGKLSNSVAFYKNKCLLQSEQISALQMKLRESTTSPILSTRGGTNGVLFPSPVHSMSQDLTYASSSVPRRRTSMGDYTPTGEESSRRNGSYASERRRF